MHVYPNSLITRPPSGPVISDNRRCTVFGGNGISIQSLQNQARVIYTYSSQFRDAGRAKETNVWGQHLMPRAIASAALVETEYCTVSVRFVTS